MSSTFSFHFHSHTGSVPLVIVLFNVVNNSLLITAAFIRGNLNQCFYLPLPAGFLRQTLSSWITLVPLPSVGTNSTLAPTAFSFRFEDEFELQIIFVFLPLVFNGKVLRPRMGNCSQAVCAHTCVLKFILCIVARVEREILNGNDSWKILSSNRVGEISCLKCKEIFQGKSLACSLPETNFRWSSYPTDT